MAASSISFSNLPDHSKRGFIAKLFICVWDRGLAVARRRPARTLTVHRAPVWAGPAQAGRTAESWLEQTAPKSDAAVAAVMAYFERCVPRLILACAALD